MHDGVAQVEAHGRLGLAATMTCKRRHLRIIDAWTVASLWVALVRLDLLRLNRHALDESGDSITVGMPKSIIFLYNG